MQLFIGNKNYSSWSMRPWLLMTERGIAFEEVKLRFDRDEGSPFKTTLHALAPTGQVPLLVDDGFAIWDTLAIVEYLADRFPEKGLWPAETRHRARARSLCAEMHAGFGDLRSAFPMNVEASLPEVGARVRAEQPAVARDLARIDAMWREQLEASGGPFLFGAFGIADAYFAPVCSRITTYALPVSPGPAAYVARMRALPSFARWTAEALAEHDFIVVNEPYRTR